MRPVTRIESQNRRLTSLTQMRHKEQEEQRYFFSLDSRPAMTSDAGEQRVVRSQPSPLAHSPSCGHIGGHH